MYIHEFQQNCIFPLLCAMSTKCLNMRHMMSLTSMLIEGIRYFDKNRPSFHLLAARVRVMLLSQFSAFSRIELYFDQPHIDYDYVKCPCSVLAQCHSNLFIFNNNNNNMTEAKSDSKTEDMTHFRERQQQPKILRKELFHITSSL